VLLITAVIALMWLAGAYNIVATNPQADWVGPLLTGGLGAAVSEEIVFRGVVYRISEEGLGTGWALAISALFFGGVHLLNPGATPWSGLAIAIEAGLLLGLIYQATRSLWVCIGFHMGWNFTQGTIWGVPVSGVSEPGLLVSSRPGPEWLSGGSWGAEGSVLAVFACFAVALMLLQLARRRNTLVPARGRRRTTMSTATPATIATPARGAPC
jgi:membrane protease YdiL (CAAX protease family)